MKSDVRKLIFEHLKEHREEVVNSPDNVSGSKSDKASYVLLFAKNRSKTADLSSESRSDVLRSVRH